MIGLRREEILPEERLPDAAEVIARGRALPSPSLPPPSRPSCCSARWLRFRADELWELGSQLAGQPVRR